MSPALVNPRRHDRGDDGGGSAALSFGEGAVVLLAQGDAHIGEPGCATHEGEGGAIGAMDDGGGAKTRVVSEGRDLGGGDAAFVRTGEDRTGDGMLGSRFDTGSDSESLLFTDFLATAFLVAEHFSGGLHAGSAADLLKEHAPGRDRARLIEKNRVDRASLLKDLSGLDDDSKLGRAPRADEQSSRGRQTQRTGARDDENRDGCRK